MDKIIIACGRTDLRKGIDGLAQRIRAKYDMNHIQCLPHRQNDENGHLSDWLICDLYCIIVPDFESWNQKNNGAKSQFKFAELR